MPDGKEVPIEDLGIQARRLVRPEGRKACECQGSRYFGFSSDALKYVERLNPRVILIDAKQLGRLMVEYGVGVATTQTLRVTEVDENFFDGE